MLQLKKIRRLKLYIFLNVKNKISQLKNKELKSQILKNKRIKTTF